MNHDMVFTGDPITFNVKPRGDKKLTVKRHDVIRDDPTFSRYLRETNDSVAVHEYEQSQPKPEEVDRYRATVHKSSQNDSKHKSESVTVEEQGKQTMDNGVDVEFDFLHSTLLLKRSTSLKPYRETTIQQDEAESQGKHKTVRFADALGLDLASVRHIIDPDEPPVVPASVRRTLDHVQIEDVAFWKIRFPQPVAVNSDFIRRVVDRKVLLESCSVNNRDLRVHGIVRVSNIAYEKRVTVRHTDNGWNTHTDTFARYVPDSNDLVTDRFYFYFNVPGHLGVRNRIEFAIMYNVCGETYWDSNNGYNYTLECIHHLGYE